MPFPKIRLKKSKQQYNVASKSAYVITVELLDNSLVECTLTAESTGRDCMDNVCQRLQLQQSDLFGLRYFSRRHTYPKIRWVELDRPLKKQLDKYAQEPYLYLGVMFYVNDVSLLEDEVTRNHYFLQLKMDVVDGRLRCNYEQAIVLASYSLQAEFGDHDPEKHTVEYLQDMALLPKPMVTQLSDDRLTALLDAIIAQHASLRGIAQQLAEIYYIVGSQQLDGYGQECFLATDDRGSEVLIGASLSGIVIRRGNVQSPQFLVWQDITNLVNHKRYFGIECQNFEHSVQFLLEDPDAAKYVWKMCVLQHTFYKMHSSGSESNELNITLEHRAGGPVTPSSSHQQNNHYINHPTSAPTSSAMPPPGYITSFGDYHDQRLVHPALLHQPPLSSAGISGAATIQRKEIENFHAQQTQRLGPMKMSTAGGGHFVAAGGGGVGSGVGGGNEQAVSYYLRPATSNGSIHPQDDFVQNRSYSNLPFAPQGPITSARSVNDLDQLIMWPPPPTQPPPPQQQQMAQQQQQQLTMNNTSTRQFDIRLPPYRPAPDYETAIRNKYGSGVLARINQSSQQQSRMQHQQQQQQPHYMNGGLHTSQPTLITDVLSTVYNNNNNTMVNSINNNSTMDMRFNNADTAYHAYHTNLLNAMPSNAYSTSTPELNKINQTFHQQPVQQQQQQQLYQYQLNTSSQVIPQSSNRMDQPTQDQIVAELQRLNIYKPPPPYPGKSNTDIHSGSTMAGNAIYRQQLQQQQRILASTSTPDLAGQFVSNGRQQVLAGFDAKMYQSPYPYPVVTSAAVLGGSSPDLVSRRTLGLAAVQKSSASGLEKMSTHRTMENLHHFAAGEVVIRPMVSNSPEGPSNFRATTSAQMAAYSAEELNNVYHLDASFQGSPQQASTNASGLIKSHLVHDIVPNNFLAYSQQISTAGMQPLQHQRHLQLPTPNAITEPIYQNQAELRQQLIREGKEPIYQNLPAHEKLDASSVGEPPSQVADPAEGELNTTTYEKDLNEESQEEQSRSETVKSVETLTTVSKSAGHVSRVAITNSREDLSTSSMSTEPKNIGPIQTQKKSVTKISIGAGLNLDPPKAVVNEPSTIHSRSISEDMSKNNVSMSNVDNLSTVIASETKSVEQSLSDQSSSSIPNRGGAGLTAAAIVASHAAVEKRNSTGSSTTTTTTATSLSKWSGSYHHLHRLSQDVTNSFEVSPKTPSSKPRGVRRKWGFHFGGSKTGSLKSLKSMKSASNSRDNLDTLDSPAGSMNSSRLGPMMLATLHGLTRSRPDLLLESMETFSAFTTPSRMPKDEIGAYLEAKLAEGEVLREFERIPKKKLSSDAKTMFKTATLAENVPRNRFKDVLPYDENRVRLAGGDKDNKSGYINASHVSATVGDQQRFYIASQNPLPQTVAHFWQMVFQSDVHLIVMLTEVADQGGETAVPLTSSNCLPYWPQKIGSTLEVADFRVTKQFTSVSPSGCYTTSTLHLVHMPTKRTRTLWHLHYTDWGDHGCPSDTKAYLEFLEEIGSLRSHINSSTSSFASPASPKSPKATGNKGRNPPVLVHCSAGVGRTGVTILLDILLYCVDHNVDVDIPKILSHLRQQRMLMVQTVGQYKFVHSVLIEYLKQSRLI